MPDKRISRFTQEQLEAKRVRNRAYKPNACVDCGKQCGKRAARCLRCHNDRMVGRLAGERNGNWKGGRNLSPTGYMRVKRVGHPAADASGNVLEHRVVVEASLGRYLRTDEHVHHVNGDKRDNRLENLRVVSPAEHRLLHSRLSNDQIRELLRCGLSRTEIARAFRVSWRRVGRIYQEFAQ